MCIVGIKKSGFIFECKSSKIRMLWEHVQYIQIAATKIEVYPKLWWYYLIYNIY